MTFWLLITQLQLGTKSLSIACVFAFWKRRRRYGKQKNGTLDHRSVMRGEKGLFEDKIQLLVLTRAWELAHVDTLINDYWHIYTHWQDIKHWWEGTWQSAVAKQDQNNPQTQKSTYCRVSEKNSLKWVIWNVLLFYCWRSSPVPCGSWVRNRHRQRRSVECC